MPNFFARKSIAFIFIGLILLVFLISIVIGAVTLSKNTYYEGVSIENINLKELTYEQALERINQYLNETTKFNFCYQQQNFRFNLNDIKFSFLIENAVNEAFSIGRTGGVLGRLLEIKSLKKNKKDINIKYVYDNETLKKVLIKIQLKINEKEKGARLFYKNGKTTILNETIGKKLNIEKSIEAFDNAIREKNFTNIPLIVEDVYPTALAENIGIIDTVLASATTAFNNKDINRSFNIQYACSKLDGSVIMPGETFSMDQTLGPRTLENGYKDAKVILFDELIDGPGGGVCQVTTTLYVAVLKSLLTVTERMHHSFTLGYVQPGQDATIANNYIDFKFTNNKDYPISINAEVVGGNLTIRILSKKDKQYNVKLKSIIVEELNPEQPEVIVDKSLGRGESIVVREAKQGKHVQVYREVYDKNGRLIEKAKISDDIYKPVRGQIRMN